MTKQTKNTMNRSSTHNDTLLVSHSVVKMLTWVATMDWLYSPRRPQSPTASRVRDPSVLGECSRRGISAVAAGSSSSSSLTTATAWTRSKPSVAAIAAGGGDRVRVSFRGPEQATARKCWGCVFIIAHEHCTAASEVDNSGI